MAKRYKVFVRLTLKGWHSKASIAGTKELSQPVLTPIKTKIIRSCPYSYFIYCDDVDRLKAISLLKEEISKEAQKDYEKISKLRQITLRQK